MAALRELCRGGGWSYAAVWCPDRRDPRLLTLGESYCEDEARKVVEKMLNQVHIVGEGVIGGALLSGKCQWISDDILFGLSQISNEDELGLFQGYTWWQQQFLNGIKTIAVVPLPSAGIAQFGSMQKVSESSEFFDHVRNTFVQMESISRHPSTEDIQRDVFVYDQRSKLSSVSSLEDFLTRNKVDPLQSEKPVENIERTGSVGSSICSSSDYSYRSLNTFAPYESGNSGLNPRIVAMSVNSKFINEFKGFHNVGNFLHHNVGPKTPLQVGLSMQPDSSFASAISAYTSLNNLPRIEQKLSSDLNMLGCPSYPYTNVNSLNSGLDDVRHFGTGLSSSCTAVSEISKDCLQSEKLLDFQSSPSPCLPMGDKMKSISFNNAPCVPEIQDSCLIPSHLLHEQSLLADPNKSPSVLIPKKSLPINCINSLDNFSIVQSELMQKDIAGFAHQANCAVPELPNRTSEETAAGTMKSNINSGNGDNDLLESMMLDLTANALMQEWWDDSVLLAGNLPNLGATASESVSELANNQSLPVGARGLLSESIFEQLVGTNDNAIGDVGTAAACVPVAVDTNPSTGCGSDCQLPQSTLQDCLAAYKVQVPPSIFPSSSYTSDSTVNGSSKVMPVPPGNLCVDDSCSLNTANSKVSQPTKPEGVKVVKKRARPGESTRPRPKDRQQIQDRVKELREIVPNGAKCSIDALLDRTIKHMLFLQSVTKYAENIKQADEPKMIGKESGVVLKDNLSASNSGGATWAYEVAGQTMACPIIVEDLVPPGQMLVEMLCEERGFFLEIADNIRGFGLTILKGLMELRDSKIWARFLVEANNNVTRMDIFLSLVQLLQQNSLIRPTDQMAKVVNNGVPSFADCQRSPLPITVGAAERLQ